LLQKSGTTGKEEQSSKRQFGDDSRPTYATVARKRFESRKRQFVDLFKSNLLRGSVGSGTTFAIGLLALIGWT
jgi:hypothetical protein